MSPGTSFVVPKPLFVLGLILLLAGFSEPVTGQIDTALTSQSHVLVLEEISLSGNTRTPLETVLRFLPLAAGQVVQQDELLAAVDQLRAADIFAEVDFFTRPGSRRGQLVLVLEVEEKGIELQFGTGNTNLDGWYLVPVKLSMDNRLGRGERLDVKWKMGYRLSALELNFHEPYAMDGRSYWGSQLYAQQTDRAYFADDIEYRHKVVRGGWRARLGRRFTDLWSGEIGIRCETVEADSFATVACDDDNLGVEEGDRLEYGDLPVDVQRAAGEAGMREALHLDLRLDSRSEQRIAGTPAGGLWGRIKLEHVLQDGRDYSSAEFDLRLFKRVADAVVATRLRAAAVGKGAVFHDRLYLGGHYTVRGFGDQSLSAPGGDTWLWSSSCELRAPLVGSPSLPRLSGLLFFDAGSSGVGRPSGEDIFMGTGFGFRLRVAWLGWLGLDCGIPLSTGPVDEAFHVHGSIGWSF